MCDGIERVTINHLRMKLTLTLFSSQRRAPVGVIPRISFLYRQGFLCSKEVDLSAFEKNEIHIML